VFNPFWMCQNEWVEAEIREFLAESFPLGGDGYMLPRNASLLEAGVIDSTGVLELIGFLESRYAIEVADDELLPENLDSIGNIVSFIEGKLQAKAAVPRSAYG
jgi:acyl carrier protein